MIDFAADGPLALAMLRAIQPILVTVAPTQNNAVNIVADMIQAFVANEPNAKALMDRIGNNENPTIEDLSEYWKNGAELCNSIKLSQISFGLNAPTVIPEQKPSVQITKKPIRKRKKGHKNNA